MPEADFIPKAYPKTLKTGKITCSAPSNIALVKYWGKYGLQLPKNPSLSFTLNECKTTTTMVFKQKDKDSAEVGFRVFFEGKENENFKPKTATFFKRVEEYVPFIGQYDFEIHTENSFPHSSGIASSASGMAALAFCLMALERKLDPKIDEKYAKKKASFLARLGSGSACRSIEGGIVIWGEHPEAEGGSNLYGVPAPFKIDEVFKDYQDVVLLVDEGKKKVSSSAGHDLMNNHPFAESRFEQAEDNFEKLLSVLKTGNLNSFIRIVENEALSLHAMMMTANPSFLLMKPDTLHIIEKIREFRNTTEAHICFTLDAGANVHVLFPKNEAGKVRGFIQSELLEYCQDRKLIADSVGGGAEVVELL